MILMKRGAGVFSILRPILTAILLFVCFGSVFSQEVLRLSPQDAVDLAIRNNLSLESARLTLDNKQRKSDLVWNQFLPNLSVSGTLARPNYGTPSLDYSKLFSISPSLSFVTPDPKWSLTASFSADLTFSFALIEGIKSIKQDYSAGLITYEKAQLQLERDIRKAYNQILLMEENAALLMGSYENAVRQADMAEANYRAGLVPRLSMLQTQVTVANMRPSIDELENAINALKGSFAMYLGLPYDTLLELEPFPPGDFVVPPDLAELIRSAVVNKPDIRELRANIISLESGRRAQALQFYTPFLRFGWSWSSSLPDPFNVNWADAEWMKSGSFTITLGYSLNTLFPFTTQGQSLKDMDNTIRSLNIALAQLVMGTELEIFTKLNSLEKTLLTGEALSASVELAELSYTLTEEAFRAGLQDHQTVQNAELALRQAQLNLLTQQYNYINDLIDLEYAVGVPFGTLSSRTSTNIGGTR